MADGLLEFPTEAECGRTVNPQTGASNERIPGGRQLVVRNPPRARQAAWEFTLACRARMARALEGRRLELNGARITTYIVPLMSGVVVVGSAILMADTFSERPRAVPSQRLPAAVVTPLPAPLAWTAPALGHLVGVPASFEVTQAEPVAVPPARVVFQGSLQIDSRPQGARVYVNNTAVGTTPLTLGNLLVGSRAVRVELEGYEQWSSAVQVVTDQRTRVTANLSRQAAQPD